MKNILVSTFGAFLMGAAMLSAQTPAGGQGQSGQTPAGGTQPGSDRGGEARQSTTRPGSSQTYTGCLSGSSGGGYTLGNIQSGSGSAGASTRAGSSTSSGAASGAIGTSGSTAMSYRVMTGSSKTNLAGMVGKRVEIVGTLSPESGADASAAAGSTTADGRVAGDGAPAAGRAGDTTAGGNTSAGAGHATGNSPAASSGMSPSAANRTLTITSIKTVTGTCSR